MSHEILLVAGPGDHSARGRRLKVIQHTAELVPGASSHRIIDTPNASIAVVNTVPSGGTSVSVVEGNDSVLVALATTAGGLAAAAEDSSKGCTFGAEAGHVAVRITAEHSIIISTDGMATVPSYWANHEGDLLFSTHLASLFSLGLPTEVDGMGLSEYLTMLHPQQDRTIARAAKLLLPGGLITWQNGLVSLKTAPIFVPNDHGMTDDEAIETYRRVWQEIISDMFARHPAQRVAIGLSGGLDSRSIAVGAALLGARPLTFAYGDERNFETRTAHAVARRLGNPHLQLPVTDDHLMPAPERISARLDSAHSPAEIYETWFAEPLNAFADVLVNGSGGGQLWGDEKTLGITDARYAESKVWARYSQMAIDVNPYLERNFRTELEHAVRTGIHQSLAEWDVSARADMTAFWRVANRQVRWGNMLVNAVRRTGLCLETPFLDSRCLTFAASLSADQRMNGRLHLRAQREIFTATADIRRSDDGNSPRHLDHVYWSGTSPYLSQLAAMSRRHPISGGRRALRRLAGVAAHTIRDLTSISRPADWWDQRSSVFAIELWSRTRPSFAERLADFVEGPGSVHAAFDETAMTAAVADLRSGHFAGSGTAVVRVAAANAWLTDYSQRAKAYRELDA